MTFIKYELTEDDPDESFPYVRLHFHVWYQVSGGVAQVSEVHFDKAVLWIGKWGEDLSLVRREFEQEAERYYFKHANKERVQAKCQADYEREVEGYHESMADVRAGR
jgi:hypothetical protein